MNNEKSTQGKWYEQFNNKKSVKISTEKNKRKEFNKFITNKPKNSSSIKITKEFDKLCVDNNKEISELKKKSHSSKVNTVYPDKENDNLKSKSEDKNKVSMNRLREISFNEVNDCKKYF